MFNRFGVKGKLIGSFLIIMPAIFIIMALIVVMLFNSTLKEQASKTITILNGEKSSQERILNEALQRKGHSVLKLLAQNSAPLIMNFDFDTLGIMAQNATADAEIDYVVFFDDKEKPLTAAPESHSKDELRMEVQNEGAKIGYVVIGLSHKMVARELDALSERISQKGEEFKNDIKSSITGASVTVGGVAIASLVFVVFLIYLLVERLVMKPLVTMVNSVNSIASTLLNSSKVISESSTKLSNASTEQASSVEETSASLEEMSAMVNNNVKAAEVASKLSEDVKEMYNKGSQSMRQLGAAMSAIKQSNDKIQDLVKVIEEIAEATKVIDEIVFQTKLLSFNASVEAERAGEHGRGFAVVAQEVGSLAAMSGQAAEKISSIVGESVRTTGDITAENKAKVEEGGVLVAETTEVLDQISSNINKVAENGRQIEHSSKEQSEGIQQISEAMVQLDSVTQDNSRTAEDVLKVSGEVLQNSEELNQLVNTMEEMVYGKGSA